MSNADGRPPRRNKRVEFDVPRDLYETAERKARQELLRDNKAKAKPGSHLRAVLRVLFRLWTANELKVDSESIAAEKRRAKKRSLKVSEPKATYPGQESQKQES